MAYCTLKITPKILRVAILDNLKLSETLGVSFNYENIYLSGINIAVLAARKQGIDIEYKTFFYGANPLDVLRKVPEVQAWKPDIILGPHYSNQFLLLKKYFSDVLILSSYASDPALVNLPSNFYSICLPDDVVLKILSQFVYKKFADRNIHIISQADCKNCVDIANLFLIDYQHLDSSAIISEMHFVGNDINTMNILNMIKGSKQDNLIFIEPLDYYMYLNMTSRIAEVLKSPNLVFVTVMDLWGDADMLQKLILKKSSIKYKAYRISPLLLDDVSDKKLQQFNQLYSEYYKKPATNAMAYITFLTVMSAVSALEQFPVKNRHLMMRERVLASYRKALQVDPNWFRPQQYGIYRYTNDSHDNKTGEVLVQVLSTDKQYEQENNAYF